MVRGENIANVLPVLAVARTAIKSMKVIAINIDTGKEYEISMEDAILDIGGGTSKYAEIIRKKLMDGKTYRTNDIIYKMP